MYQTPNFIKLSVYTQVTCLFMCVFQLLKLYEHLVSPLAQGVVQLVQEFGCQTIVREVVREISETDSSDLMQNTSGTRAYSQFLVEVAERLPELIMPAINALTIHLEGEVCLTFLGPNFESCTYSIVQVTVICSLHLFQLSEAVCWVFSTSIIFVANMSWEMAGSSSA